MQPADPYPLLPLAWAVVRQLLALALLAVAAAGAGHLLTGRLATASRREALAVATATGLGVLGSALFLLGLIGGLRRWVVLALLAAAAAAGVRALAAIHRARGGEGARMKEGAGADPAPRFRPAPRTVALALALAVLPTFVWSLFPPTGFDATTYHLPYVRAFAAAQRLVVVPDVIFPIFPQLGEALFTAVLLATGADVTTHVVQLLALGAVALLLDAAGRRFFSPAAGPWAAALWLAHPLAHYQAASAYVDLLLALFCLLAVHAWESWREGRGVEDGRGANDGRADRGWLVLSGAAGGFAAGVKYLGLLWLGVLGLVTLAWAPRRRRLAAAAVVGLAALAVAGPWYARIHHHTGNPVHPLLDSLFAEEGEASDFDATVGIGSDSSSAPGAAALVGAAGRALARPAELGRFAWRASFDRRWFSRQSALAPWHFLLVPLAAAFCLRDRRLLRWLLLVAVYALLWTTHDPRYQLPSMALLALAGGGALHHLGRRFPGLGERMTRPAAAWALAAALALPGPAYAVYKIARHGPLPVTPEARQAHLDRELAGHAGVRCLNELHGDSYTVFALDGPYLTYFARGRLLGHALGPTRAGRVLPLLGDPAALHRELRAMDADHLLVVHGPLAAPLRRDAAFDRLFRHLGGDGRYDLFALRPAAAATPAASRGG